MELSSGAVYHGNTIMAAQLDQDVDEKMIMPYKQQPLSSNSSSAAHSLVWTCWLIRARIAGQAILLYERDTRCVTAVMHRKAVPASDIQRMAHSQHAYL
jgi:hypothetical protein